MKGLERFETFAEQLLEGSLGRWMGGRLEPIELAKRLARVMDDHQTVGAGKVFVPNRYTVRLNPANYSEFESFRIALEEGDDGEARVGDLVQQAFDQPGRQHRIADAGRGDEQNRESPVRHRSSIGLLPLAL